VIRYQVGERRVEFFYNQQGREVFRREFEPQLSRWKRIIDWVKGQYANPNPPPLV
jgi:hypothetical protein